MQSIPTRPCQGRRIDSRGPYTVHVLVPVAGGLESACLVLRKSDCASFKEEEPTATHPLCAVCRRVATPRPAEPGRAAVRPKPAAVAVATVAPTSRPDELSHRMVWASHAFGSASRLRIVDELRRRGRMRTEALREACGQWEGMFDLSMDALTRARIVDAAGKHAALTEFGNRLFDALEAICAAGDGTPDPAAPTH
jgi:hypothetical protein